MILLQNEQVKKIIYRDRRKYYTYGLCRQDGSIYYVGVGIRNRVFQHLMDYELEKSANRLKVNITNKAIENGGVYFVIFMVHRDREVCLGYEKRLVSYFGRIDKGTGCLANMTDGGENWPNGRVLSEENRRKLSERSRRLAGHLSVKTKQYWESLSEEEKNERLLRLRSSKADSDLLSLKLVERWSDPEYKTRLSEKQKVSQSLVAETHSANMREKWADPEFREYMLLRRKIAREKKASEKQILIDQLTGE